jgi:hypothetical protein
MNVHVNGDRFNRDSELEEAPLFPTQIEKEENSP